MPLVAKCSSSKLLYSLKRKHRFFVIFITTHFDVFIMPYIFFLQEINEKATLYFRDGKRKIDYVLAYEPGTGSSEEAKRERRRVFEGNLKSEGLQLEYEGKEVSYRRSYSDYTNMYAMVCNYAN